MKFALADLHVIGENTISLGTGLITCFYIGNSFPWKDSLQSIIDWWEAMIQTKMSLNYFMQDIVTCHWPQILRLPSLNWQGEFASSTRHNICCIKGLLIQFDQFKNAAPATLTTCMSQHTSAHCVWNWEVSWNTVLNFLCKNIDILCNLPFFMLLKVKGVMCEIFGLKHSKIKNVTTYIFFYVYVLCWRFIYWS